MKVSVNKAMKNKIKNGLKYLIISIIFPMGIMYGGEDLKMKNILEKCPSSPNCVISLEEYRDDSHYIEPLSLGSKSPQESEQKLKKIISELDGKISEEREGYIRADFFSKIFKFKDVAEFMILPEKNIVMIRSAAETGWSDLGVNRKRIEKIRELF